MFCLLQILLLLFSLNHGDSTVLAHQTALERVSKPSVTAAWNTSAASPLIQANGSSHTAPSASESYSSSPGVINDAATLPVPFANQQYHPGDGEPLDQDPNKLLVNYKNVKSGFCAIGDDFCSFKYSNGTVVEATPTNFSDQCLLWDSSCSGNRTMAIEKLFNVSFDQWADDPNNNANFRHNDCFLQTGYVNQSDCDTYNPPDRLAEMEKIVNWMRSPQCVSAANEWITMTGYPWGYVFAGGENISQAEYVATNVEFLNSSVLPSSCCGACDLSAPTVDLYYWPDPDANVSCTSIIGDSLRPLGYGATTTTYDYGGADTYWACNTTTTFTSSSDGHMNTLTDTGILEIAVVTYIASLGVKISLISPWSSSPCVVDDSESQSSNQSMGVLSEHTSVYARGYSLIVPSSVTQDNELPVSTTISGSFTL